MISMKEIPCNLRQILPNKTSEKTTALITATTTAIETT